MANARRWLTKTLLGMLLTTLIGGFAGAMLVRFAPGYGVDERELDVRLSTKTITAIRRENAQQHNLALFYMHYLAATMHGDLGYSMALGRPVRELLSERLPETLTTVGVGLGFAWSLGLGLATAVVLSRDSSIDALASILAGILLCLPTAILALWFFLAHASTRLALGVIVFPKIFRYSRNFLLEARSESYVIAARAKGLSEIHIFLGHILPACAARLVSLGAVSVSLALSAAIPVEVICGLPGIGQLAWQAAMARDLCLLVNLTMVITAITVVVNSAPELLKKGACA
ncbi:MAG: ABC transporter permease [Acidobacteria bacterium]|nr:ABC transporter permease [Acidobacteriota bacterium]